MPPAAQHSPRLHTLREPELTGPADVPRRLLHNRLRRASLPSNTAAPRCSLS